MCATGALAASAVSQRVLNARGSGDLPLRGIRFGQARRSTGRAACRRSVRGGAHGPTASRAAGVDYRPGPAGANHARPGHGTSRSISASRGRETIAVERNTRPSTSAPILGPLQERVFKGRGPRRAPGPARTGTRPRRASGRQRLAGARRTPRRTPALLVAAENPTRPAASNPPIVRSCVGRSPLPARPGSFSRLPRRRPGHPFSDLPAGPGETLLGWQEMYHVFKKRGRGLVLSGVLVVVWIALVRVVVQVVFVACSRISHTTAYRALLFNHSVTMVLLGGSEAAVVRARPAPAGAMSPPGPRAFRPGGAGAARNGPGAVTRLPKRRRLPKASPRPPDRNRRPRPALGSAESWRICGSAAGLRPAATGAGSM